MFEPDLTESKTPKMDKCDAPKYARGASARFPHLTKPPAGVTVLYIRFIIDTSM